MRLSRGLVAATAVALVAALAAIAAIAWTGVGSAASPSVEDEATAVAHSHAARLEALTQARFARTLMVFGDSISARFNDSTGDEFQGFWSMLGDGIGATPRVRAQGGAGFVNPGLVGCKGSTFGEQLASPQVSDAVASAAAVVIEGGRTDTVTCGAGGMEVVPSARLRQAAETFMDEVARLRGANDRCTIVVVPWGPKNAGGNRERITQVVKQVAKKHGFTFVDTMGLLTEHNTLEDRIHPDVHGNHLLANRILAQSAARSCVFRASLASLRWTA